MTDKYSGIEFIISNVVFEADLLPFKISNTMTLRSATEKEKELFYQNCKANSLDARFIKLTQLKYWVVQFTGTNDKFIELEKIASLLNPKLHFGINFYYDNLDIEGSPISFGYLSSKSMAILQKESRNEPSPVSKKELHKLKKYYELFTTEAEGTIITTKNHILDHYFACSLLYRTPNLLTMSLFSIIEALIVHKPQNPKSSNSINHQIKNKLHLLFKKFDNKINHNEYFENIKFQTCWGQLYDLRSNIAHGHIYDLERQQTIHLKSLDNVNLFLDNVVQELIKLLLDQPEFMIDLKAC